jgi:hypothetical protein
LTGRVLADLVERDGTGGAARARRRRTRWNPSQPRPETGNGQLAQAAGANRPSSYLTCPRNRCSSRRSSTLTSRQYAHPSAAAATLHLVNIGPGRAQHKSIQGVGSEFADVFIRLLDYCARFGVDLEAEYERKMAYNQTRPYRHGNRRS